MLRRSKRSFLPLALVIDLPSIKMSPSVTSIKRLIERNNVDLPAPDKPTTTTNSPLLMVKLTFFKPTTFLS